MQLILDPCAQGKPKGKNSNFWPARKKSCASTLLEMHDCVQTVPLSLLLTVLYSVKDQCFWEGGQE